MFSTATDGVVIHNYYRRGRRRPARTSNGQVTMVVVYKRPDEGGVHLRAPYAGAELKLTKGEQRQYEEMPEDRCRELRRFLRTAREK
jgi:hypothetical protein